MDCSSWSVLLMATLTRNGEMQGIALSMITRLPYEKNVGSVENHNGYVGLCFLSQSFEVESNKRLARPFE